MPLLLLALVLMSPAFSPALADEPAETPSVRWFDDAGGARWRHPVAGPSQARDVGGEPLRAPSWLRPVPDHPMSLLDGGTLELSAARGRVLIVDFWASWCPPCLQELPHLQQLHRELRARGLDVVTVNAGEPVEQVRSFVDQIGLELPVALLDRGLDRIFHVGKLPTVVLIDRDGRIRERWNGYSAGQEQRIGAAARKLLDGAAPPSLVEVGRLLQGEGQLVPRWTKRMLSDISGLAVARDRDGRPWILVGRSRELEVLDADGAHARTLGVPLGSGRLRPASRAGKVCSFRPGATSVAILDIDGWQVSEHVSPEPVLDVAWAQTARGDELWAATTVGLRRLPAAGESPGTSASPGIVLSVATEGRGADAVTLALSAEGRVVRLGHDGSVLAEFGDLAGAWRVVAADGPGGGWGVVPDAVGEVAPGRFAGNGGPQLALGLADRVEVVDTRTGAVIFRASIPGLGPLAGGDLDGDGHDELLIASGPRLIVLTHGPLHAD